MALAVLHSFLIFRLLKGERFACSPTWRRHCYSSIFYNFTPFSWLDNLASWNFIVNTNFRNNNYNYNDYNYQSYQFLLLCANNSLTEFIWFQAEYEVTNTILYIEIKVQLKLLIVSLFNFSLISFWIHGTPMTKGHVTHKKFFGKLLAQVTFQIKKVTFAIRKVTCQNDFPNRESRLFNLESLFGKVTCESQRVTCASRFPKWESDFGKLKSLPNTLSRVKTMGRE